MRGVLVMVGCMCSALAGGLPFVARVSEGDAVVGRPLVARVGASSRLPGVVVSACVCGLPLLACACAFDGFLL